MVARRTLLKRATKTMFASRVRGGELKDNLDLDELGEQNWVDLRIFIVLSRLHSTICRERCQSTAVPLLGKRRIEQRVG